MVMLGFVKESNIFMSIIAFVYNSFLNLIFKIIFLNFALKFRGGSLFGFFLLIALNWSDTIKNKFFYNCIFI